MAAVNALHDRTPRRIRFRQIALFAASMIVPSVVLVGLGVRMIVQQDELADKHAADARRLRANDYERALLARLDLVRLDPADSALALTGTVVDGRLLLPWDRGIAHESTDERFRAAIMAAEREEFGAGRAALVESLLQTALARGSSAADRAYARLLLARNFLKAHRQSDAEREYRALLRVAPTATDGNGMPIGLYAAERLVESASLTDRDRADILRAADASLAQSSALPPAAAYQLRAIVSKVGTPASTAAELRSRIDARIADVEHALALQQDIQTLLAQWRTSDGAWLSHGDPLWLVGAGPLQPSGERRVHAVRADALAASMARESGQAVAFVLPTAAGESLGDRLPGLKVRLPDAPDDRAERSLRRAFYAAALLIVLSVTLFGGYLLLRDVRREMRLAALRSQFVSSVSHELKTPLTAIRMFAETLQLGRADASVRDEYLDTIVNESERLTRLLNNVLDFSKIEEGRKAYRRVDASLADVVRVAARAMAYPLEQQGFRLRVDVDDTLPPAHVDADALEQAILNLLTNAMKYSGDGREIGLRLAREGDHAIIAVHDDGIGIPAAEQHRIFDKFYRVSSVDNERIPGTGLGLALVDHIVKAHDGTISVESVPGHGSTFTIVLPLPPAAASLATAEALS